MRSVNIFTWVGSFAENKEQGKKLRTKVLLPALKRGEQIVLDFDDVSIATQSFIHALIAEAVRSPKLKPLDRIAFANCNENVRAVIEVVVSYCQDDWSSALDEEDPARRD